MFYLSLTDLLNLYALKSHISNWIRLQVLVLLTSGRSVVDVARQFNYHRNININLRQPFQQSGSVRDGVRSDRPMVTTALQYQYITLTHLRVRFKTGTRTARQCGIWIVWVKMRTKWWPDDQIIINDRNRNLRWLWAKRHLRWTRAQWARVLFWDEWRLIWALPSGRSFSVSASRFTDAR